MGKKLDMVDKVFGRLTVLEEAGRSNAGAILWECECECGKRTIVRSSDLVSFHTKSCGCLQRELVSKWLSAKTGGKNPRWKGGRYITSEGYVMIKTPGHPRADKKNYVPEQILVMEKLLERYLRPGETVHHWNEKKADNRSENLELFATRGEHIAYHNTLRKRRRIAKQCLAS